MAEATALKTSLEADGYTVVGCENVIGKADVLEKLSQCDAAIILESSADSKVVLVKEELAVIDKYVNRVLGMVIVG